MPELQLSPFALVQPTRSQTDKCQICKQSFGITTRQHLCKRCYRFVCSDCSPHKIKTYRADLQQKMHRLCNVCYTESEILRKYVEKNKISWAEDSEICRLWLKQLSITSSQQSKPKTNRTKFESKRKKIQFSTTIQKLWSSFNYSFRQLIGQSVDRNKHLQELISQENKKQKSKNQSPLYNKILQQILDSLSLVISIINSDKIEQENVLFILIFFLIHASLDHAVLLTKQTVNILTTNQVSLKDILYYLEKLQCSPVQRSKIENYLDLNVSKVKNTATINYLSVQLSIQILCSFISKKDTAEIQKAIAYLLNKRKQYIVNNYSKSDLVEIQLLRNHQGLDDGYKKFLKLCQNQPMSPKRKSTKTVNKTDSVLSTQNRSSQHQKEQQIEQQNQVVAENEKPPTRYSSNEDLAKQNQRLRKKNKNQQQEIIKLKESLAKAQQKQKRLIQELENRQFQVKKNPKYDRKKNRSEEQSGDQRQEKKQIVQKSEQKDSSFQVLHTKNKEIKTLKQQVQQLKKQLSQQSQFLKTQQQSSSSKIECQNLKEQLKETKEMNKKLLKKMKELSNMLMDKQDQQLKQQTQSIEVLNKYYQKQIQQQNSQQCLLF